MDDSDSLMAVVAHGLLNSMAMIRMALGAVERVDLDQAQRLELWQLALGQTDHVISVLKDLMRGVAPEVLTALEALSVGRDS